MVSIGAGREKSNVSAKGTDMQAESAPGSSASVYPELKDRSRSDDRERAVQACYELLSSGHPLSEILDAAKRVANLNKTSAIPDVRMNIETTDMPGEARGAASEWDDGEGPLPVEASFADHPRDSSGALALNATADATHSPGALKIQDLPETARVPQGLRIKSARLTRTALFWIIPAVSLTVLVTAGKPLLDADLFLKAAEATAVLKGIPSALKRSEHLPATPTAAAENISPSTPRPEPDRADPEMTPELIRALLDRGDAFLRMADVESARLFYERAAAVGNPQAALRLGLTYDPSFLAQAGLSNVRGDLAEAHSWLQRARALGTSDADVPSIGRAIESPRTTERVVTGSPTEPATEGGTTGQASTQFLNDPALSVGAGKRTRPATVRSSPSTSANQRHTRTHQNGPICPHAGQCLTPP